MRREGNRTNVQTPFIANRFQNMLSTILYRAALKPMKRHLHIALAASKPYFSNEDIREGLRLVAVAYENVLWLERSLRG